MSSDTAPAAVPAPATPPASSAGVQPGGMAGLLSAIEPARPAAFQITPTADGATGDGLAEGASSDAFGDLGDAPQNASGKSSSTGKDTGIIRAYLLAGAERWRKGADARLKQLDIKKAKAQAFKESRKVNETRTVNRAEKIASGPSNSGTAGSGGGAGKSLSSKNSSGGTGRSNSGGGRGDSSGRGSSGHGSGGRGTAKHDRGHSGNGGTGGGRGSSGSSGDGSRRTPNGSDRSGHGGGKGPGSGGGSGHSGGGSPRSGHDSARKQRPARSDEGSTDTNGKAGRHDRSTGTTNNGGSHRTPSPASGSRHPLKVHSPGSSAGKPWRNTPRTDTTAGPQQPVSRHDNDKTGPYKPDLKKTGPNGSRTTPKTVGPVNTTKPGPHAPKDTGKRLNTGASRETGYRDGSRVATAIAHGQAYRDGYTDGYRDTKDLAAKDKARLDRAHDDRKKQRQQPPIPPRPPHPPRPTQPPAAPKSDAKAQPDPTPHAKQDPTPKPARPDDPNTERPTPAPKTEKPAPKPADASPTTKGPTVTQPDTRPAPTPVQVTDIDAKGLHLGNGAARDYMNRGEVRTLCQYQRRLDSKADILSRIADYTRTLEAHAQERAKTVTTLLEQARAKEAGHLIGALTQMQEAANVLVERAAQVNKRAVRAHEACTTLIGNVKARYAAIYQAVVDSPETAPAEMSYYMEMDHAV